MKPPHPLRAWLAGLAARPGVARTVAAARGELRRGLMPFRAARLLEPRERWGVVRVWGALGGVFGCAWLALLAALVPSLARGVGWLLLVALLAGAVVFFAAAGYLMAWIGNRLVERTTPRQPE
jgi:hypothetical protein